jgi:hypothetical protein
VLCADESGGVQSDVGAERRWEEEKFVPSGSEDAAGRSYGHRIDSGCCMMKGLKTLDV